MITPKTIGDRIAEMCSHFTFEYHGKRCGVDPIYYPDKKITTFEMWCGSEEHEAVSVDEVMRVPLFDGKSLTEIAMEIDIIDF